MKATIKITETKKLVGMRESMSLTENHTYKLFRAFMSRKKEIEKTLNTKILDLKIYPENYFTHFDSSAVFQKWAAVQVSDFENIPDSMETFVLTGGKYAVFNHNGNNDSIFHFIFSRWLPNSEYKLDNRPHFDVLSEKTKINGPDSEQEIWIPIK